jgi:hypothetical protein
MIPIQLSNGKTKDELRSVMDFDLPYAYHGLHREKLGEVYSTWKTSLWVNFFMGGLAIAIGCGIWIAYQYEPFEQQSSFVAKLVLGLVGALFFCVSVFLGLFSLTRGRLVLNLNSRELSFYRFWFSFHPHRRIRLDDIKNLLRREVISVGSADDPGHTYDILVAELRDGRLASIAIDSPFSIETKLNQAIGSIK